jgi:hypothetical protein
MTRVVLLGDYLDYARQIACMQRLVQRVENYDGPSDLWIIGPLCSNEQ